MLVHGLQTRIVVPIFNAAHATEACLRSLLAATPPEFAIELYDDASTQPEMPALLARFAAQSQGRMRVVRQAQNLGFVANCNRAMANTEEHVLLLNSDTQVSSGWLPEMLAVAQSARDVASVTPFSNNAEICSFPELCVAAPVPVNLDVIARALRLAEPSPPIELPTAVGFCMWINRHVLRRIGDFDWATFGRGYGEENDWCCRATGHGFRHLLAARAYVTHVGGQSFAPLGERPGGAAMQRLLARYPHYARMIQDFIAADPIAPARLRALQHGNPTS